MAVDVAAFTGCTVRGGGPIFMANDGTVTVSVDAAPGSNSRIDVVYFKQNESASPYSDANDNPVFGVEKGTAGAVPVKPTIPTGAVELATILIPSGVSATNAGGVVITQTFPFTATTGGPIWVRNATERGALSTYPAGTRVRQLDTAHTYESNGTVLTTVEAETRILPTSVAGTGVTLDTAAAIVAFTASSSISINGCFTAEFNEYRIIIDIASASAGASITFRFRASGTDLSSSSYSQLIETVSGTSIAVTSPATATSGRFGQTQTTGAHIVARVTRPASTANPKLAYGDTDDPTPVKQRVTNSIASATSFDGITIIPSTGNITGTVRIIGIR
ncbi:MAG TPA: hypothetical protein VNR37_03540 [Microbacteriaceae bacterium]|nr:hypothetical protein [Microbacteriaceae bacterium]